MTEGNGKLYFTLRRRSAVLGDYGTGKVTLHLPAGASPVLPHSGGACIALDFAQSGGEGGSGIAVNLRFDGDGGFTVSTDGMINADIPVEVSPDVMIEYFDVLSSGLGGMPCLKLRFTGGNLYYLFFDSEVSFDCNRMCLHIAPGRGSIRAVRDVSRLPYPAAEMSGETRKNTFGRGNDGTDAVLYAKNRTEPKKNITPSFSECGGIYVGDGRLMLPRIARFERHFCRTGNKECADRLIGFMSYLIKRYGELPFSVYPDGSGGVTVGDCYDSTVTDICGSVSVYIRTFGADKTAVGVAAHELSVLSRLVRGGMMPPDFRSREVLSAACTDARFYGSETATGEFYNCAAQLLPYITGRRRESLESVCGTVRRFYRRNFSSGGLTRRRLEYIKKPHRLRGYCDMCGEQEELERTGGKYLCGRCAEYRAKLKTNAVFGGGRAEK